MYVSVRNFVMQPEVRVSSHLYKVKLSRISPGEQEARFRRADL